MAKTANLVSFQKLENGSINKLEFIARFKAAFEEKLKELKKNLDGAEDALYIHCFNFFDKFSYVSEETAKGVIARMFINEKETANLIMGLLKS